MSRTVKWALRLSLAALAVLLANDSGRRSLRRYAAVCHSPPSTVACARKSSSNKHKSAR
jgi:hypothetical protein